jgi:hypothetical protein
LFSLLSAPRKAGIDLLRAYLTGSPYPEVGQTR